MSQVFHISRVWGSRHGGSYYSRAMVEELIRHGWTVTVLAEEFLDSAAPAEQIRLRGFFRRELRVWRVRLADIAQIFHLAWSSPRALVVVQGDLPRLTYLLLQWMVPLIFVRQDGVLTCPGNHRFLARSRSVCREPAGLRCFLVHRTEGCLGKRSLVKRVGRWGFRMRDRVLLRCLRHFVTSSRYLARAHGRDAQVLYPAPSGKTESQSLNRDGVEATLSGGFTAGMRDLRKVIFCARLDAVKGAEDALWVLGLLPKDYRLEIAGDGVERARLEKLVEELGLAGRVKFLGWLNAQSRDRALRSAGVMVMPSLWDEAFGMAGIEALSQGTPVVAYDVGGIGEWCCDGAGILVPCGNLEAAAKAIRQLAEHPAKWGAYSRAARKVAARFERGRFGRELEEILREART